LEKTFKTKTGFCHITSDQIILTREGVIGDMAKVMIGDSITGTLVVYGLLSIAFIFAAYISYLIDDIVIALFLGWIGLYLAYLVVKSRKNTATPVIDRKEIKRLSFNPGIPGLTRARFEIVFNDNGRLKNRIIILPGTLAGGQSEAQKALQIMREERLLY